MAFKELWDTNPIVLPYLGAFTCWSLVTWKTKVVDGPPTVEASGSQQTWWSIVLSGSQGLCFEIFFYLESYRVASSHSLSYSSQFPSCTPTPAFYFPSFCLRHTQPWLVWSFLWRSGWPQTHRGPPAGFKGVQHHSLVPFFSIRSFYKSFLLFLWGFFF